MSANDANPTGGEEKTRIDSPNIKSSVESEPESEVSEAELRRKAKETVAIDGIPIDEKDIKYHSKNIKEVDTGKLFVKVEGAEERKKAAIRAMEQKQRAEKKRVRDAIHAEKKSAHDKERKTRLEKLANIFWAGKRKIATMIGIVAIIVLAIFVPMIYRDIIKPGLDDANLEKASNAATAASMSATDVLNQAQEIFKNGDSTSESYAEACAFFEKAISEAKDENKIYLAIEYGNFIYEIDYNPDKAAEKILAQDPSKYSDFVKADYYAALGGLYEKAGDQEKADYYNDKMGEFVPEEGPTGLVDYGE